MIDYIRTYKQFISSHQFYEGIRMTAGVMVPVLLFARQDFLALGVTISIGALAVGITDNPGPIHHRRNGMLITMLLLFFSIVLTGFSAVSPWLTILLLVLLPFVFSMIGIYGNRAASAGLACMLIMVLNVDKTLTAAQIWQNALLTLTGGAWYFLLSIGLHRLRPYKLVQQVLGDCMRETAGYLRLKASFYEDEPDFAGSYRLLADAQVRVHQKQEATRELLFKTRSIVKESTHTGRVLLMAFIDTVDLFERIMTSQQQYTMLHRHFDNTRLMEGFRHAILQLADDLDYLGIAFQEGRASPASGTSARQLEELEAVFLKHRVDLLNEQNADAFISLRHVLHNLKDLRHRIDQLHAYSSYDLKLRPRAKNEKDLLKFVARSDYNPKILLSSLNLQANIFRHSLRVSLALLAGYILSLFLPLGHDYWILLTIIVILKPAYALSRQRNFQRLGGTIAGAILAAVILYAVKNTGALVAIIMLCMLITWSFIRVNYLVSVIFMTTYIVIAFYFLKAGSLNAVLEDRIVDTAIGSFISFVVLYLVPPKWEQESIRTLCADTIKANRDYYACIAAMFTVKSTETPQYKLKRKDAYVALANLGDAFQRMLNEPKRKQQRGEYLHQMIVGNHVIISHIATLSAYGQQFGAAYALAEYKPVITMTVKQLNEAAALLETDNKKPGALHEPPPDIETIMKPAADAGDTASEGTALRNSYFKTIHDQFEIILKVAVDIKGIARKL